ncbi:putative sulfate permease 2 [Polychaeton citri CBS 116435]|uniref:Sulfate permease 2 n=1 Tax=Polychaeton citri CBS 116435 TaxID=1314669 RepID=A0A9P4QD31_9PEZI|nr:putative sulfate permease 2 [Polychaeton citri CBS 116435]
MASARTKLGHGLAKGLGIKLNYRNELGGDPVTRGESVFSVNSADSYIEEEPTSLDWIREVTPDGRGILRYLYNLFPFTHWIFRYNLQWLYGDLVAGITIGAVVVPQGMAYAKLANLPPEFGLYSSFMGVLIYWFFATSKDITIGPVAVMSTIVGNIITDFFNSHPDSTIAPEAIGQALAIIVGAIVLGLGLLRLGFLVEFISLPAISAFMTGSAISIASGQVAKLMGIKGVDSHDATYLVIINTLKRLPSTTIDAALGLTALTMLYLIRSTFNYLARKQPQRKKFWFFCNTLRTAFVILLYTLISWLMNLHLPGHKAKNSRISIIGTVPRGFKHAGAPDMSSEIIDSFVSQIPLSVIVLLIEHISIAKSFGRINNYTIDPSQELIAIGVSNLLGPLLGAYPVTGSFSRTAIKSKAGVRTPFAGVITAVVVLLAIYALPAVFFYIPNAALSAVIIHAVGDLITPPNTVYQFWRISPLEVFIFFAGVFVTVFVSIEDGVYVTVCVSAALLLFRVVKARGRFLGKLTVYSVVGDHVLDGGDNKQQRSNGEDADKAARSIFVPLDHNDGSNPNINVEHPYPGVFIYRFSEGFNYPNANHYLDGMTHEIFKLTQRTNPHAYNRPGDRPWNDPAPRKEVFVAEKPTLKAIILDFSSVNNVDVTSIQNLIDVRNQLDLYAAPNVVQWHIACVNNRWTKRALASGGFGYLTPDSEGAFRRWKPVFSVAEIGGASSAAAAAEEAANREYLKSQALDIEGGRGPRRSNEREITGLDDSSSDNNSVQKPVNYYTENVKQIVVQGINRPLFHLDLTSALQSAIRNIEDNERSKSRHETEKHESNASESAFPA